MSFLEKLTEQAIGSAMLEGLKFGKTIVFLLWASSVLFLGGLNALESKPVTSFIF